MSNGSGSGSGSGSMSGTTSGSGSGSGSGPGSMSGTTVTPLPPPPQNYVNITAAVVGTNGLPIPGMTFQILAMGPTGLRSGGGPTDANGQVSFQIAGNIPMTFSAFASLDVPNPSLVGPPAVWTVSPPVTVNPLGQPQRITFTAAQVSDQDYPVTVQIVGSNNLPVPNITFFVNVAINGGPVVGYPTDANGTCTFQVPGSATFAISIPTAAQQPIPLPPSFPNLFQVWRYAEPTDPPLVSYSYTYGYPEINTYAMNGQGWTLHYEALALTNNSPLPSGSGSGSGSGS